MKSILAIILTAMAASPLFGAVVRNIPDKDGMTIKGVVYCGDEPVQGAQVSDGVNVTLTDENGWYYLASAKECGHVFVCNPKGYKYTRKAKYPEFYKTVDTERPSAVEQADFELERDEATDHTILFLADIQMCGRNEDIRQYEEHAVGDINTSISNARKQGKDVYVITLGDQSYNTYWHSYNIGIPEIHESMNLLDPDAIFNCMGNHDNDPKAQPGSDADFNASLPYQKALGPRYYSQNIGNVHYVFLDNIHYINDPAPAPTYTGINNKRNYKEDFTPEQLAWLRKDLANVSYDTPIIVAMHGPMFRWKKFDHKKNWSALNDEIMIRTDNESTRELLDILRPYKNVHSVSGHSHKQNLIRLPEEMQNFTEHNISGTCGAWWRTRATGLKNLCPDGTPVAYELFNIDGSNISWEHKTFEYDPARAFYAWDMNGVKDYFKNNEEMRAFLTMYPEWTDYSDLPDNYIYVNLWAWDQDGKLKITENGKELPVEMVKEENPLYTLSYMVRTTVWNNEWNNKGYHNPRKFMLFRAKASTPDAPVEISWTDYFGKETKSTLERPAAFNPEIL